jgi:hypothetical protein
MGGVGGEVQSIVLGVDEGGSGGAGVGLEVVGWDRTTVQRECRILRKCIARCSRTSDRRPRDHPKINSDETDFSKLVLR